MAYISEDTVELKELERLPLLVTLKDGTKAEIVQASAEVLRKDRLFEEMCTSIACAIGSYPLLNVDRMIRWRSCTT